MRLNEWSSWPNTLSLVDEMQCFRTLTGALVVCRFRVTRAGIAGGTRSNDALGLGFLMVTTSFVPTPWIHVSKDDSATFGGNLFIPLFVGLGSILVSTRMALDTETIEPNLRPVPRFEFLLICVKVILATVTAYTEAEFPALGVPSLDAEARLTTLNTARNGLPILACGVLLLGACKHSVDRLSVSVGTRLERDLLREPRYSRSQRLRRGLSTHHRG